MSELRCQAEQGQVEEPKRFADESLQRRFWPKVDRSGPGGCWLWGGSVAGGGYGKILVDGRTVCTHRVVYELYCGAIPDGLLTLHRCDNPRCVNPAHLFCGSHADNMADKAAKGRCNSPQGEKNGSAKLTEEKVREIRTRYAAGDITQVQLAREFGVCVNTVGRIIKRKFWKYLA